MADMREGSAARVAFVSAVFWFALGVTLGFFNAIKLTWPDFMSGAEFGPLLSFNHLRPAHIMTVIVGWISLAFAGAMFYIVPATCGTKLFSEKLGVINVWLWNVAMVLGILTVDLGMTSGREYSDFIWPIDLAAMLLVFIPMAINVWMTILQRTTRRLFIANWFFAACVMLVPSIFLVSQASEIFNITGLNETYLVWWMAHNWLGLWITPVSSAIAYYVIPKVTGNPIYSHRVGHLHFWSISTIYATPSAHHLMGAPLPEWIKSFASITGILILVPALAFVTNLVMTMKGKWSLFVDNPAVQWVLTGVLFGIPLNFQGAFQQTRAINWYIHGTHWIVAHAHMALLGFSTFIEVGAIYIAWERLTGRKWYSPALIRWHFWMTAIGFLGLWTSLTMAGLIQAAGKIYETQFIDVVKATHPYMAGRVYFGILIIAGQWLFLWHMIKTATSGEKIVDTAGNTASQAQGKTQEAH